MSRNIVLHISYEGTHFHGYQIQPGQRTVQSCVESALSRLLQQDISVTCAGRTDTGVHALAQVVNFKTNHSFPLAKFVPALRGLLPPDIAVVQAWEKPPEFHARFSALARHYRYWLQPSAPANPFLRSRVWLCPWLLDVNLFQQAWKDLRGKHHFAAFCKSGSYRTNHDINVMWSDCLWQNGLLRCDIMADSFLYNMVRSLIGTTVDIARGRLPADHLQQLLQNPQRQQVGRTAPPEGLYLYNVIYPPTLELHLVQSAYMEQSAPERLF